MRARGRALMLRAVPAEAKAQVLVVVVTLALVLVLVLALAQVQSQAPPHQQAEPLCRPMVQARFPPQARLPVQGAARVQVPPQHPIRPPHHPASAARQGAIRARQVSFWWADSGRFAGPTPQRSFPQSVTDDNQSSHYQRYGQPLAH